MRTVRACPQKEESVCCYWAGRPTTSGRSCESSGKSAKQTGLRSVVLKEAGTYGYEVCGRARKRRNKYLEEGDHGHGKM